MITPDFVRTMARYNRWQNRSLYAAADGLDEAARRLGRGAFFGSIHRTLSHLLWADAIWMSRLSDWEKPDVGIPGSADWVSDWPELVARRAQADEAILDWAAGIDDGDLTGRLRWYSGATGREVEKPRALCIVHVFNHQTHHRGQVHAMLTQAGARPGDTDLPIMTDAD